MNISSLLAVIIFCFLLFLDRETRRQAAHNKLGLNLDDLSIRLERLQERINVTKPSTAQLTKANICKLIDIVADAREKNSLLSSFPGKSAEQISEQVLQTQKKVDILIRGTSSYNVSELFDEITVAVNLIFNQIQDLRK